MQHGANRSQTVEHPAQQRFRVNWLRQLIGLFGAPSAWAAQMSGSEILTSSACYPHEMPLNAPQWSWLNPVLAAISTICFMFAFASAHIAWKSWQRSQHESEGAQNHTMEIGEGRTRFLALLSTYSSCIFLVAIVFTACALLMVDACKN